MIRHSIDDRGAHHLEPTNVVHCCVCGEFLPGYETAVGWTVKNTDLDPERTIKVENLVGTVQICRGCESRGYAVSRLKANILSR